MLFNRRVQGGSESQRGRECHDEAYERKSAVGNQRSRRERTESHMKRVPLQGLDPIKMRGEKTDIQGRKIEPVHIRLTISTNKSRETSVTSTAPTKSWYPRKQGSPRNQRRQFRPSHAPMSTCSNNSTTSNMSRERLQNHRAKRHYLQSAARRATSSPHNKGKHSSGDRKHHSLLWTTKRKGGTATHRNRTPAMQSTKDKCWCKYPLPILRGDVGTIRREWGHLSLWTQSCSWLVPTATALWTAG